MAADPKKRQKKLEKQKARRKAKKHEVVKAKSLGVGQELRQAASAPVEECWRRDGMFEDGMGHVMFSRRLPSGFVAFSMFLVDMFCLGVKDAMCGVIGPFQYTKRFGHYHLPYDVVPMDPAGTRKLVEGAVDYAQALGLPPHPDYQKARLIFGDVDPAQSTEEFEYGQDGQPHFINGPYDSPARCRQILNTLRRTCGEGNFQFTLMGESAAELSDMRGAGLMLPEGDGDDGSDEFEGGDADDE